MCVYYTHCTYMYILSASRCAQHDGSDVHVPEGGCPPLLASFLSSAASLRSFVAILRKDTDAHTHTHTHAHEHCNILTEGITACTCTNSTVITVSAMQYSLLHFLLLGPSMLLQQLQMKQIHVHYYDYCLIHIHTALLYTTSAT